MALLAALMSTSVPLLLIHVTLVPLASGASTLLLLPSPRLSASSAALTLIHLDFVLPWTAEN